jgi:hypothetical protein
MIKKIRGSVAFFVSLIRFWVGTKLTTSYLFSGHGMEMEVDLVPAIELRHPTKI